MRLFVLLAALPLSGCFLPAPASKTFGPNGKSAYSISCPGSMNSWGHCYERAGDLCGASGYDIVMRDGLATSFGVASGFANTAGGTASGFSGSAVSRNILVQCKTPT